MEFIQKNLKHRISNETKVSIKAPKLNFCLKCVQNIENTNKT